jgi:acyl-homoserine-lactone acylase
LALVAAVLLIANPSVGGSTGLSPDRDSYKAEIRRTDMGVPHIKADNWGGLGYGYGYAQAQDNLCTLADAFLTYRGERSKYFGGDAVATSISTIGRPKNLDSDFFHRQVIPADTLGPLVAAQPPELRALVAGFAAGYNRYIKDLKPGGANAACAGQPWVLQITADDVYRRMLAGNLAGGFSNFVAPIAEAQPPGAAAPARKADNADILPPALQVGGQAGVGSNAIGFGAAGAGPDGPLLFGNPHWYWRGPDRFYQAQLTIPGRLDVSGVSFLGIPVILIGYNADVAWSHTVSTARRFGFYQLTLAPDDPTAYLRDGKPVKMTATPVTVEVRQDDGRVVPVSRILYRTQYGPMVDLSKLNPALGWTQASAFAIRDINADSLRSFQTWLRWSRATSLDDFIAIQRQTASMPWVNTIAIGRGNPQAWYADIGAIPNVPPDQLASCATPFSAPMNAVLPRVPVLDGSKSTCDWRSDADSVQPGALGPSRMPSLRRGDYVANMNDGYWLVNPKAPLAGFPDIIGPVAEPLSTRTRMGQILAQGRIAGTDGYPGKGAAIDTVGAMVLNSRALTAELFKNQLLAAVCTGAPISVAADPLTGQAIAPAQDVDPAQACAVLKDWDNTGNADARGARLWDEVWARLDLLPAAQLYAVPFDPADPVNTPRQLKTDAPDALRQAFGAAILKVQQSGFSLDAPRSATLFATRDGEKLGLFGGCPEPGYFTVACPDTPVGPDSPSMDGNPHGNSYMQIVTFPRGRVEARTLLAPSLSDDPKSPHFGDGTRRYAAKQWMKTPFAESEILADPHYTSLTIGE